MFGKDGISSVEWVWTIVVFFFFSVCGSEQKLAPWREAVRHAVWMEKRRTRSELRGRTFFAQRCMSNRLLTLARICFPSVGKGAATQT